MSHESGLRDQYGRRVATLRISLTDHCNFRCVYCMPPEGLPHLDSDRYLSAPELERFVRLATQLGIGRVKLTGGEPLIRRDVVDVVRNIRAITGVTDLSLTTNGARLRELSEPLRDAGLDRVNISLDSLDRKRFAAITRVDQFDRVLDGIAAAMGAGLRVKINVVVLDDMTHAEIVRFAEMAVEHDIAVRFLEFMPLCGSGWESSRVFPIREVRDAVRERFDLIETTRGDNPAQAFDIAGGRGRVGFIASLTEPFCADCSRMRLTAEGKIRPCLFSNYELDAAPALRNGSDEDVLNVMSQAVWNKPWGSEFMTDPFREGEQREQRADAAPLIHNIGG